MIGGQKLSREKGDRKNAKRDERSYFPARKKPEKQNAVSGKKAN